LDGKGYLKRSFNQSRALDVAPKYFKELRQQRQNLAVIPMPQPETALLGTIAAGYPIETYPQPETLSFAQFTGSKDVYALEVRGESMIEDHIMPGDYVLVEKTAQVRDGEIVVALVDGSESTLKRFYRDPGEKVCLQPANASMQPIVLPAGSVEIQGRVLAVHRRYH
jgi:repressor LexA